MFTMVVFMFTPFTNFGQSIQRQCVSSYGASGTAKGAMVMQTAGQSFSTHAAGSETGALQGFQQSHHFNVKVMPHDQSKGLEINVYPNPASKMVTIKTTELMEGYHLNVTDNSGKLLVSQNIDGYSQFNLLCEDWKNGVYFIRVNDANGNNETLKLLISK